MRRQILSITRKELSNYFGSPLALIFLGTFVAAILFIFFTVETFFARGVADVRPLFRWMPILLIFLLAALTMRQWSEEQRSGTQELLLTLPISPLRLVLGKFLAVMIMIALALALTLPLPITVALMGNLDWGPVIGGYLAAILLAAAYAAIGLFVSSRTDNQIVALIVTALVGGFFFLIGSRSVTDLFGGGISEVLWSIGTGSRFESIQRGVIDLRDLVYYLSLTGIFLTLNTISLDSVRWSREQRSYRRRALLTGTLLIVNLAAVNLWLSQLPGLRLDLTAQRDYSLSQTTKDLLANLQEPLQIRAFISEKNHPLLTPLTPRIRDMLREYEIAADGRLTAEVIDPIEDPEVEAEINQSYGIRPAPFQVTGRNESSVINAYFDVLVQYGDQNVVLNFQDLIQVEGTAAGDVEVRLRNLEYDLTSAIKRTVFGFQSVDAILAALDQPVQLTFFVTPASIPESLRPSTDTIDSVAGEIAADSEGKLIYQVVDPDDPNSQVGRQALFELYGLQPIPVSFLSADSFYAYLVLQNDEEFQIIPPLLDLTEGEVRTAIESALKRTSTGFLKVIGLWTPPPPAQDQSFALTQQLATYDLAREQLGQDYTVRSVDLSTGRVPADIDALVVFAPQDLTEEELYAMDQFLMRGGSVTLATSGNQIAIDNFTGELRLEPAVTTNLRDWLSHNGVSMSEGMVLDPQNQPFPITVVRDAGGFQVQEIQAVNYPFFVDVRPDGMDSDNPITANLPAVTVNWTSPVTLQETEGQNRESTVLLQSSPDSWLRAASDIQPNFEVYPELGFPIDGEQRQYPLAVSLQGTFNSYFEGRPSPFEQTAEEELLLEETETAETGSQPLGTLTVSPDSSRLVVIGSSAFAEDFVLNLSARLTQDRVLNNLQFLQNVVDWSVEDLDLLSIRSRGSASRVLAPMTEGAQNTWEITNYVVALVALLGIYYAWRQRTLNEQPLTLHLAETEDGE